MSPHLFRWDLDKTYLKTDFESWRGMLRAATEHAEDKRTYPGAKQLLQELSKQEDYRIGVVSGSPGFMREVLAEKLRLDGVRFSDLTLKPQMEAMKKLHFRALREQVGYKLPALLQGRLQLGPELPETLVGDDVEMDVFVYSLYADLLAGRVSEEDLGAVVDKARLYPETVERIRALVAELPQGERVGRILVHLDKRTAPAHFAVFGSRVVPFHNYFQAAAVLFADRRVSEQAVLETAASLVDAGSFSARALSASFQDIVRRGGIPMAEARATAALLDEHLEDGAFERGLERGLSPSFEAPHCAPLPALSYPELFDMEHKRRKKTKARRR